MLRGLRDAIFARREEIADMVTRETGKPRVEAIFAEMLLALDTADFLRVRPRAGCAPSACRITTSP